MSVALINKPHELPAPRETVGDFTESRAQQFLHYLAETGLKSRAAYAAQVSLKDINYKLKHDDLFKLQYDEACQYAYDNMEAEAIRRAMGYEEDIIHKGEVTGTTTKYSDTLLMFLLKGRRSDVFKDKSEVETTHRIDEATLAAMRDSIKDKLLRANGDVEIISLPPQQVLSAGVPRAEGVGGGGGGDLGADIAALAGELCPA